MNTNEYREQLFKEALFNVADSYTNDADTNTDEFYTDDDLLVKVYESSDGFSLILTAEEFTIAMFNVATDTLFNFLPYCYSEREQQEYSSVISTFIERYHAEDAQIIS